MTKCSKYVNYRNSPFLKEINRYLSQMRDMNIPELTLDLPPLFKSPPEELEPQALNYEFFPFPSMILFVGYVVSMIACMWEVCRGGFEDEIYNKEAIEEESDRRRHKMQIQQYQREKSLSLEKTFANIMEEDEEQEEEKNKYNPTEIF